MLRVAVILSAIALIAPAVASANRWSDADAQRAMTVADNHWPDSPCYGQHIITWESGADLDAAHTDRPPNDLRGWADMGDCRVWIAWDRVYTLPMLCTVLMHEFGHNAGMEHSTDPSDPMYPDIKAPIGECKSVSASAPRAHYVRWRWRARWNWR